MSMGKLQAALLALVLLASPAYALTPGEILQDQRLETRARALSAQLRCLVCQNQSIDDSDASLARDLRQIVRERLLAGETDEAIKSYLVARYGDFVLLQPPLRAGTVLLWSAPALLLLLGGAAILFNTRRKGEDAVLAPLDDAEAARLAAMLERDPS